MSAHALTHAHPDHQGASAAVCERLGIPYWVGATDVPLAEDLDRRCERDAGPTPAQPADHEVLGRPGPARRPPPARGRRGGRIRVLDVPGHSPGHIAYWRESDRVLILGDVLNNMDVVTGRPGLRDPKPYFTTDPVENRRSAQEAGRARAEAGAVRPRGAAARHAQVRGLRRRASRVAAGRLGGDVRRPPRAARAAHALRARRRGVARVRALAGRRASSTPSPRGGRRRTTRSPSRRRT